MLPFVSFYVLGSAFTLWFQWRHYEEGDPSLEIGLLWCYHLPILLSEYFQHKKAVNEDLKRRMKLWVDSLLEASRTSKTENWGEKEWQQWNITMRNRLNISLKKKFCVNDKKNIN